MHINLWVMTAVYPLPTALLGLRPTLLLEEGSLPPAIPLTAHSWGQTTYERLQHREISTIYIFGIDTTQNICYAGIA